MLRFLYSYFSDQFTIFLNFLREDVMKVLNLFFKSVGFLNEKLYFWIEESLNSF